MKVYDAEGKVYDVEPCDAREYVASGSYFKEPPAAEKAAEVQAEATPTEQPADPAPSKKRKQPEA